MNKKILFFCYDFLLNFHFFFLFSRIFSIFSFSLTFDEVQNNKKVLKQFKIVGKKKRKIEAYEIFFFLFCPRGFFSLQFLSKRVVILMRQKESVKMLKKLNDTVVLQESNKLVNFLADDLVCYVCIYIVILGDRWVALFLLSFFQCF